MTTRTKLELGGIVLLVVLGIWVGHRKPATPVVDELIPNTTTIQVPKVTEKVIKEYVTDPALQAKIHDLLVENSKLKLQVLGLSSTVAELKSSGGVGINGGDITQVTPVVLSVVEFPKTTMVQAVNPPQPPVEYNFSDYHLKAKFSGKPSFSYELSQKFSVLGSHSRSESGKDYDQVVIYENTPSGLVKLDSQSLVFEALPNQSGWHASPRIQGGVGVTLDLDGTNKVGIAALQWLRRGTSSASENTSVSFLSPAITSRGVLTILPFSWNTGTIKHSPFTNLYVSPAIGLDKSLGAVITATF